MAIAPTHRARSSYSRCGKPTQGVSTAAWTPESLTGLVDEWDAAAEYCTTDCAADLESTSSQHFTKTSPALAATTKMTIRYTMRRESTGTVCMGGIWDDVANKWSLWIVADKLRFYISTGGSETSTYVPATNTISNATNYEVVIVYDGTQATASDRVTIYFDGVDVTGTMSGTVPTALASSSALLAIGARSDAGNSYDGVIQNFGIAADALTGAALTAAHTSTFYEDMTPTRQADWDSFWNLNQSSGARNDSAGSNDLTAVNTPSVAAGVASGTVQDRSPVKSWTAARGDEDVLAQSTIAYQPVWLETGGPDSNPVLSFDGTDDFLSLLSIFSPSQNTYEFAVAQMTATGANSLSVIVGGGGDRSMLRVQTGGTTLAVYNGAFITSSLAYTPDTWYRHHVRLTGATSGTDDKVWVDNSLGAEGAAGSALVDNLIVGAHTTTPSRPWIGRVGRLVVADGVISDDDRASLSTYMADYVA